MSVRHIAAVVGTRPEIVKLGPVIRMLGSSARFLHTCQHADEELSGVFVASAGLAQPETLDGICGEPRHTQIGRIVERLGDIFAERPPAAVLVQGDTNTASAAAQAASYIGARRPAELVPDAFSWRRRPDVVARSRILGMKSSGLTGESIMSTRVPRRRPETARDGRAWVPGGRSQMRSADFYPEERPGRRVAVDGCAPGHRRRLPPGPMAARQAGHRGTSPRVQETS